jgi:hypothetical protein
VNVRKFALEVKRLTICLRVDRLFFFKGGIYSQSIFSKHILKAYSQSIFSKHILLRFESLKNNSKKIQKRIDSVKQ